MIGPTFSLDTIVEVLIIGIGTISGEWNTMNLYSRGGEGKERGRKGGKEGGREGGREGRKGGREGKEGGKGGREGRREGGRPSPTITNVLFSAMQ